MTAFYALGALLLFLGERLFGGGVGRGVCSGLGAVLLVGITVARVLRLRSLDVERRRVERDLFRVQLLGVLGLVCYGLQSDLGARVLGRSLDQSAPRVATVLAVLYPVFFAAALVPLLLGELAYRSMAQAPRLEGARVRDALLTGLGAVAAVVFAFTAYYVADERDVKADLSYFRTTRPGTATHGFVRALTEPVQVSLFFPPGNDVGDLVREYFKDLGSDAPKLEVKSYDQAVDPAKARELGVSNNGSVVIARGARREQLLIQTELERARSDLKTLDVEVMKRLLTVARTRRTLYLTAGHGERSASEGFPLARRATIRAFREMLRDQNNEVKDLSAAEGLATEVPKDAAAVLVIGPTAEFIPEEQSALKRYFEQGGRVLYVFDPESSLAYSGLMAPLGVTFVPTQLANERVFVPRAHENSDHTILVTSSFSSSPAVTTLSQSRSPVILLGAGYLDLQKSKPAAISVDMSITANLETFNDVNGNFIFDAKTEVKKAYPLMAAITLKRPGKDDGRAVVLTDSDAFTDVGVFENRGNGFLAADILKWLSGEEATSGTVNSETDVPLEHTRNQDVAWFYATIFLAPAVVLGVGYGVTRRKRRAS